MEARDVLENKRVSTDRNYGNAAVEGIPVIVIIPKAAVADLVTFHKASPGKASSKHIDVPKLLEEMRNAVEGLKTIKGGTTVVFGDVTVNFPAMEAVRKGEPFVLTTKEFKTLKYLVQNARRAISRDELLNEVWGYENYPCTRTVDNHILRLRQKLERDPSRPVHFQTMHGAGYKFLPQCPYCRKQRPQQHEYETADGIASQTRRKEKLNGSKQRFGEQASGYLGWFVRNWSCSR